MRIGITCGDPAGIGAEVILKALSTLDRARVGIVLFGSRDALARSENMLQEHVADRRWLPALRTTSKVAPGEVGLVESGPALAPDFSFGNQSAENAHIQWNSFAAALDAVDRAEIDAVVTGPWNKGLLQHIGRVPVGHTEILAERYEASHHVMMLAGPRLRVCLVTTHLALADVSTALSVDRISTVIQTTARELNRFFGIQAPRIAVCGLNPHAGESGIMGNEEITTISPAIAMANHALGEDIAEGPFPSDTLFAKWHTPDATPYDAVVCMYHDQGLIPLKMIHFYEAINLTLGLPIIRTSPDHGTAYDIAGRGLADAQSMQAAITAAIDAIERRQRAVTRDSAAAVHPFGSSKSKPTTP